MSTSTQFAAKLALAMVLTHQAPDAIGQGVTPSFSMTISTQKKQFFVGEKPTAIVNITNLTDHEIVPLCAPYRVHIETLERHAPQMTELSRHLWRQLLPSDGPDTSGSNFCPGIAQGQTRIQKYDLSAYYDLSQPGTYRVYVEILEQEHSEKGPEVWVNSGTTQFEVKAGQP